MQFTASSMIYVAAAPVTFSIEEEEQQPINHHNMV